MEAVRLLRRPVHALFTPFQTLDRLFVLHVQGGQMVQADVNLEAGTLTLNTDFVVGTACNCVANILQFQPV
jgi:hypothetical protein